MDCPAESVTYPRCCSRAFIGTTNEPARAPIIISNILTSVRSDFVTNIFIIASEKSLIVELDITKLPHTRFIGSTFVQEEMPRYIMFCCLVRGEDVFFTSDVVIEVSDKVIVFLPNKHDFAKLVHWCS